MVTAEYNSGLLANPYLVMTGQSGKTLDKQFAGWGSESPENTCKMFFQRKHWFDAPITIKYRQWLHVQYAGKKILLIWDHAPAHDAQVVRDFIEEAEVAG